jgi:tetratricopeptide (TPR) repeat protein
MLSSVLRAGLLAGTMLAAGFAQAQSHDHSRPTELKQLGHLPHETPVEIAPADTPLFEGLGDQTFAISTDSAEAQKYFDQGLTLAYGFNHLEARRSFRMAQELDPTCAMCFWGEALVLGPNINWPMEAAANEPALAAIREAQWLAPNAGEKEQALITALAHRYSAAAGADRATLDLAYADAMREVAQAFPDDLDIATLYAESIMDITPWDYWADGGSTPKGRTAELIATLERVLAEDPHHVGAIHFYIHAVEASDRPERAEPYADRLAAQNVSAGHLAHMPSHIYYRVGRYADSLAANIAAVAADEAYLARVEADGIYPGGYYPHNIHFLLVSAQMAGDGRTAIEAAEKLEAAISDEIARQVAWVQPIKAAPYFAHAQFSTPETILALPEPHAGFPYVVAMWRYARGTAQAAAGNIEAARAEAEAIAELARTGDLSGLTNGGLPGHDLLALARHIVLARVAQAENDLEGAVNEFEAAAAIEAILPFMEPPLWYYPVKQSLGAALLLAGETARAEEIFRTSLEAAPNNGWACFGLAETMERSGNAEEARELHDRLARTWAGDRSLLDLNRL